MSVAKGARSAGDAIVKMDQGPASGSAGREQGLVLPNGDGSFPGGWLTVAGIVAVGWDRAFAWREEIGVETVEADGAIGDGEAGADHVEAEVCRPGGSRAWRIRSAFIKVCLEGIVIRWMEGHNFPGGSGGGRRRGDARMGGWLRGGAATACQQEQQESAPEDERTMREPHTFLLARTWPDGERADGTLVQDITLRFSVPDSAITTSGAGVTSLLAQQTRW